ncbi:MAG: hypothetical protein ACOZQL_18785 [Myxococcota bacterium]
MKHMAWAFLFVAGCSAVPQGNALRVVLETTAGRPETCFAIDVLDAGGATLDSTRFPRLEDRTRYLVAINRAKLPETVRVQARALIGPDCETADRPNGVTAPLEVTFDPKQFVEVTLRLTGADQDGDGFVATASGGLDCNDGTDDISPASTEECFGDVDHDCDGLAACADPDCSGKPCGGPPRRLHFAQVPAAMRPTDCGAVTLEVLDAEGRVTSPANGALFVPSGPFTFFLDGQCAAPLTSPALQLTSTVVFGVRPTTQGSLTLTAESTPLMPASATMAVAAAEPYALSFVGPAPTAVAGRCSDEVVLGLVDDAGAPTRATELVAVTLASDAGAPFSFYVDADCTLQSTAVSLPADAGTARVWFTGQVAAPFTLTASAPPLFPAQQSALIRPAEVATVQVTPPAAPLVTARCSGAFVVDAFDTFGNRVIPTAVSVSVPDAGVTSYTGASCATPGASDRFALIATEEGSFTASVTADGVTTLVPLTTVHPGPAGSTYRWPLTINTGARAPTGGYAGYTLLAAFDTRDVVDAGMVRADARDLRVFFREDGGWREVDRLVEGANSPATLVRFASQTDLPSNATDRRYSLFSGAWASSNPPANPRSVYLFFDDFEEGTLGRWTVRNGLWERATDRKRSGNAALHYPGQGDGTQYLIEAKPALSEADVFLEAWWNVDNTSNADFAQFVRLQAAAPLRLYETNLVDGNGWSLAWFDGTGAWQRLEANASGPTQDTWIRIGLSMSGDSLRVFKNGTQIVPGSGARVVASPYGAGNVGFRKWDLGGSGLWIDDVTVRRFTEPEPTVTVGPSVTVPP